MNIIASRLIDNLGLREHPEGGFFTETYRSNIEVELKDRDGSRALCTSIYYLLSENQFSAFHIMKSDEVWHFYSGSSLTLHVIGTEGKLKQVQLGNNIEKEAFQAVVKSGSWLAASVNDSSFYSLVGCTLSPGFNILDWNLGDRPQLTKMYPQHKELIKKFTRPC